MNTESANRRRATGWFTPFGVVLGLWGGLILLFAVQTKVANATPWPDVFKQVYSFWLPWIICLPAVVWISLKFSFERPQFFYHVVIHAATCVAIIMVNQLVCHNFLPLPPTPFDQHGPPPPQMRIGPDILIYLVTMFACVAFTHHSKSQERERRAIELEARLAQAKLQALRMQINPHFLFNTLNAISTLVHTSPQTADDMITDLGELFRISLESSDAQEIPLAQELELLRCYLSIEQRRFGDRLLIEQQIAPGVFDALVPTLILQPLVENAIRHGVESRSDAGKIVILAQNDGDRIMLSVSDNGKKPVDFSLTENKSGRRGIGLTNTQARLQQLYGEKQSLGIGQSELGGWKVEIILPFRPISKVIS